MTTTIGHKWLPALLAAVTLLTACGSSPPVRYFTLSDPQVPDAVSDPDSPVLSLGPLRLPEYLNRSQMVTRGAGSEVIVDSQYRWAEPLRESLRTFLASEIASEAGIPIRARSFGETDRKRDLDKLIDVRIDQLHGTTGGDAILVAYWAVIDPGRLTWVVVGDLGEIEENVRSLELGPVEVWDGFGNRIR